MPKLGRDRFHFLVASVPGTSALAALEHVLALGATRLEIGHACPGAIALADVDDNEFCLVEP